MILGQKKVIDGRIYVRFRQDDHAPATSPPRTIDCFMNACTGLLRLRLCKLSKCAVYGEQIRKGGDTCLP